MRKIFSFFLLLLLLLPATGQAQNPSDDMKPTLTYYFDALCGWCFGFSPVIAEIHDKYQDQLNFEVVSGGLSLGSNSGPIGVVAPYIKAGAYKDVESYTGVKFGEAFVKGTLEEGTMVMNSIPPATALAIVREAHPEKAFEFAGLLHRAVYVDGMEPEDVDGYAKYAAQVGMDPAEFNAKMKDPAYAALAQADFQKANANGANGFPTVILDTGSEKVVLTRGYRDLASFESLLKQALD